MALYLREEHSGTADHYALTMDSKVLEPNLYFRALMKYSAVPVHPRWRAWLYKRALKKQEIETLTCHRVLSVKINLNEENLAETSAKALKRGSLKRDLEIKPQLEVRFDSPGKPL